MLEIVFLLQNKALVFLEIRLLQQVYHTYCTQENLHMSIQLDLGV